MAGCGLRAPLLLLLLLLVCTVPSGLGYSQESAEFRAGVAPLCLPEVVGICAA